MPRNASMVPWHERYVERFYRRRSGWIDGTEEFHRLCSAHLHGKLLEVGPGPANATSDFLATLGELHGIDPDADAVHNPALTSVQVLNSDRYPYADATFDCVVSNYVVEHVANPHAHLREIHRVLKRGGIYLFRTPNRFHYVALISALTPHWFHKLVANPARALGKDSHDPYPTVYAMNSRRAVTRLANVNGFRVECLKLVEKEPSYGKFSRVAFLGMTVYERAVNATDALADLRSNIFAVLRST